MSAGVAWLVRGRLATLVLWAFVALALPVMLPVAVPFGAALAQGDGQGADIDYAAWQKTASAAEKRLSDPDLSEQELGSLREELTRWRAEFQSAQTANSSRIATVREQIAALGAAPADGATEAPEVAARRKDLNEQLTTLQAPGITAEEAYRRAAGLVSEIDSTLRERQTDQLLQLWPSPINPANWPEAAAGVSKTAVTVWQELSGRWTDPEARAALYDNMPLILALLAVAIATTVYARRWITGFSERLEMRGSEARQRVLGLTASLGQVVVPMIGVVALSRALVATGMLGDVTRQIVAGLPVLGLALFFANWLGGRAFPRSPEEGAILPLPPERRAEGRFLATMMGLVVALAVLRVLTMDGQSFDQAVTAVASFPILCLGGLILWRTGRLIRPQREDSGQSYMVSVLGLVSRAGVVIGIIGPLLAAFGYVTAAEALIFPSILSLGLLALLVVLQGLFADLWAMVMRSSAEEQKQGLMPVLLGFGLTLLSVPVFTLIWGARVSDLTELWGRFREGFQLGDTRISPTDFLIFAVLFSIGYMATRLFQAALRNTILPRTQMERGGQNALVSGVGYVGIFLAALLAINATGIDLSGLAIVASALSVGIGFGLQNIVQNFVSGIILMIERPVSEGDWIEVGATQGIVKAISVRSTRIQTFDRSMVVVPNADLVSQRVTNFTRFSLAGRLIVPVVVSSANDSRKVAQILREIAEAQPLAVLNPPPAVLLTGIAGGLNFEIRLVLRDVNFSSQVRTEIYHQILKRFPEEGVEMPSSSSTVSLGNPDDIARALSLGRVEALTPEDEARIATADDAATGPEKDKT